MLAQNWPNVVEWLKKLDLLGLPRVAQALDNLALASTKLFIFGTLTRNGVRGLYEPLRSHGTCKSSKHRETSAVMVRGEKRLPKT